MARHSTKVRVRSREAPMVDAIAFASAAACGASYLALRSRRRPFATAVRGAFLLGGCFLRAVWRRRLAAATVAVLKKRISIVLHTLRRLKDERYAKTAAGAEILVCLSHTLGSAALLLP